MRDTRRKAGDATAGSKADSAAPVQTSLDKLGALSAHRPPQQKAAKAGVPAVPLVEKGTRQRQKSGRVASTATSPLPAGAPACKGSHLTNSACKACFRCTSEKSMLLRNYRLGFITKAEMQAYDIDTSGVDNAR